MVKIDLWFYFKYTSFKFDTLFYNYMSSVHSFYTQKWECIQIMYIIPNPLPYIIIYILHTLL